MRVLGVAWLTTALACGGSGSEPGDQRLGGYRSKSPFHKVQLDARKAAELEKRGAKVLGDYGSFKLVQVDDATLDSLGAQGAELRDDYDHILLNAGVIDTASEYAKSQRGMGKRLSAGTKGFHIVHFDGPVRPEWLEELKATGVRVVTYIPNNAYLVYGNGTALSGLQRHIAASPAIRWDGEYLDDYKLSPAIQTATTSTYAIQLVKDEETNGATLELIRGLQSREAVVHEALGFVNVVAAVDRQALYEIVQRPDVLSIQPRPTPRKFDERQDMILAGQLTGTGPKGPGYLAWLASKGFTQAQFTASGFGVDVSDSGLDNGTQTPNHFGLYLGGDITGTSRVVYNRLEGTANVGSTISGCDGHGNLNAHIVAGFASQTGAPYTDAAGFHFGLGVAPFVKVGSSVVFDPDTFTDPNYADLQARAYRDGMRISSNSWGSSANGYDVDAQQYDALVRDAQPTGSAVSNAGNQEMVIVFAAGNDGSAANTVGSPATAKNVITVGASENVQPFGDADLCGTIDSEANSAYDIVAFSSRGPTADGRKKPDLMAPGTHVSGGVAQTDGQRASPPAVPTGSALSCFDGNGVCGGPDPSLFFPVTQEWYTASSGTSHSTPAVAGGAALVRQYFINQGVTPPSPAMTKAWLMGSARYMTGTGANDNLYSNNQGMGLMDLGMAFDGVPRLLDDQNPDNLFTATGQTRTFSGVVGDSTKPFRVTLAWTDAPGSTAGSAWKNNLDLTVTVGTSTYKGNVFTGANSVTGGTADSANNVESVFLPAGLEGPYSVTVTATNINSDGLPGNGSAVDQDFALVAYNSCASATPAPEGTTATAAGDNRIEVNWTPNGSASYNIYRATTAGGPYTRVGSAVAPPFVDTGMSGGSTYYYVVRAMQCSESPRSNEASVVSTGVCTLPPTFAGLTSVNNGASSTCTNTLAWSPATPSCGGSLSYSVYRSTSPGFTPSAANRIATGVTGTSFSDDLNLSNGTPYYYVVRATETGSATFEETNTVQQGASPTGAVTPGVRYFDDFDSSRPTSASAYWSATATTGSSSTAAIVSDCHYQSATKAYRFGSNTSTACGGTYSNNQQVTLALGGNGSVSPDINGFAIPAGAVNPQMTFNVWYDLESKFDGVYLVYSTTGATGPWTAVSDTVSTTLPYISAGGYDDTLSSSPTTRIWTSKNTNANGSLKPVTVNLSGLAGQKVWFGFRFYSGSIGVAEGFYVDDVRITADAAATCTTNAPPPGPVVAYKVSGLPASVVAGAPATFTVSAVDAVGVVATSYSGSASLSSSDTKATLPSTATLTAGVASNLPVTFGTMGTQSIVATDVASPAMSASASTTVTVGAASKLVFTVQPADAKAGASISPAVKVGLMDAYGNTVSTGTFSVTMSLGNNAGGGTLGGTTTATMSSGVATFSSLNINKVGTGYTLKASATGLADGISSGFNITPATASKLAFVTQPSTTQAGSSITPAVQVAIQDTYGNVTTSTSNVTLALSASPAGATLSGTTTVAAVNGVATFSNLSLNKVGTGNKLTATATSLTSASSNLFEVIPGDPYRATITRQPTNVQAGAPITPAVQVTLYDRAGNLAAQSTAPVSVSLSYNTRGATVGGTTTVNAVAGVATFDSLTVDRSGVNYTLVAGASGTFLDTSVGFNVSEGPPAKLAFRAPPANAVAGTALAPVVVEVQDGQGNRNTASTALVTLSLGSPSGGVLAGSTSVAAVNGLATFSELSIEKAAGGYTLHAEASGLTDVTSGGFSITPAAAASLAFSVQPGNVVAGAAFAPAVKVSILDAFGNVVTGAQDEVSLALVSPREGSTLTGTQKVAAVNGVASFSGLSINRVGEGYALAASAGSLASTTSSAFDVLPSTSARLVFKTIPTSARAGATLPPVEVELQDALGKVLTDSKILVTLSLGANPSAGLLIGSAPVSAVNGVAKFDGLSLRKAGSGYTLVASAEGFEGATSAAFEVTPGEAASFALVFPASVTAGQEASLSATAYDAHGNVATSYAGPVKVTSSDTAAALPANATFVEGVLGGLKVTFKTSGLKTLTLTDAAQSTLSAVAQTNVTPFAQPTVAVTSPAGGSEVSGEVSITAEGAVAAGTTVGQISILVDGMVVGTGTDATLTAKWDSSKAEDGSAHTITAVISDSAGNVVGSAPVGVTVKNASCGCGATSGTDASVYLGLFALARYVSARRRQTKKAA